MKQLFISMVFIFLVVTCYAQDDYINTIEDTLTIYDDIFEGDQPLEFQLKLDIKQYQKTREKGEKHPAEITYLINDSVIKTKNIRIQARGAFRRQHCALPPFWINLKKANIENVKLATTKKIKLVNHCNGSKTYANYVLKEYLIYKMYNLFTPYSFRVRLVKMKYIDTGRKNKETEGWAFMIEPEKMMAERLNSSPVKLDNISHTLTDTVATDRVAMFQYMVGNADYSIAGRHNVKLIKILEFNRLHPIPIPYDFDYSGLIDTYYAVPSENLGIENVRQRYYMGLCRPDSLYLRSFDEFKSKKVEMYKLIQDFEYLEKNEKQKMISYLDEFYSAIENQTFINNALRSTCR